MVVDSRHRCCRTRGEGGYTGEFMNCGAGKSVYICIIIGRIGADIDIYMIE